MVILSYIVDQWPRSFIMYLHQRALGLVKSQSRGSRAGHRATHRARPFATIQKFNIGKF